MVQYVNWEAGLYKTWELVGIIKKDEQVQPAVMKLHQLLAHIIDYIEKL